MKHKWGSPFSWNINVIFLYFASSGICWFSVQCRFWLVIARSSLIAVVRVTLSSLHLAESLGQSEKRESIGNERVEPSMSCSQQRRGHRESRDKEEWEDNSTSILSVFIVISLSISNFTWIYSILFSLLWRRSLSPEERRREKLHEDFGEIIPCIKSILSSWSQ